MLTGEIEGTDGESTGGLWGVDLQQWQQAEIKPETFAIPQYQW